MKAWHSHWSKSGGYLNTARFGLPPQATVAAVERQQRYWQDGEFDAHWLENVDPLREAFARLIGSSAERIGVGRSTASLVGGLAGSLADGATVLVPEGEHNSNTIPFMEQRARGINVVTAPLQQLADHVRPGVAVVAFSLVQSSDGRIADLRSIAGAARRVGALVCVDGTQGVGWLPFDASLCDLLVVSAYKWLLSPLGIAFVVLNPASTAWLRPATPNWFACTDPMAAPYGLDFTLAPGARRFDVVPALGAVAGARASLELLADIGVEAVYAHNTALADAWRGRLGLPSAGSAIVNFEIGDAAARLTAAGVRYTRLGARARVAFHLYNTSADVELLTRMLGL